MKLRRALVASICAFVSQVSLAQSLPDAAKSAVDHVKGGVTAVVGGIGSVLGAIFNPVESDFHSAVQEKRFADALQIYDKNADDLRQNKDLSPDVQAALQFARDDGSPALKERVDHLADLRKSGGYRKDLEGYLDSLGAVGTAIDQYIGRSKILGDFQESDPALTQANAEKMAAMDQLRADLPGIYGSFPHEKGPFSSVYQDAVDEAKLFEAAWPALEQRIATETEDDAKALLKNTSSAWQGIPRLKAEVDAVVWKRLSANATDPIQAIRTLGRVKDFGIDPADIKERPRILVYMATPTLGSPVAFKSNEGGVVQSPAEVQALTSPVVVVLVSEAASTRKIVDKREVQSSYVSGSRQVPNPDYEVARMDCQRAQANYANQQARNTFTPARNWAGALLQGLGEGVAAANANEVCNRFAATPAYNDQDVYAPYTFNVTDVQLSKTARGRILAISPALGTVDSYPLRVEEVKKVAVAYGRKQNDSKPLGDVIEDAALENMASAPLQVDVDALIHSVSGTPERHTPSEILALLQPSTTAPPTAPVLVAAASTLIQPTSQGQRVAYTGQAQTTGDASVDSRMESVVAVFNPRGYMGAGFYVEPKNILTNFHVVEGASTVEVRNHEGHVFTGRVVKKDIGNDLALISVEEPGPPVEFASTIVKAGEPVEAIGHPQGFFFSVTRGIVSAVRQLKGVLAPGGGKTLVIQTDTSVNPGNSGGPLYLHGKVIGVNTIKFKGAEGIGFAVHYSEVLKFLSE